VPRRRRRTRGRKKRRSPSCRRRPTLKRHALRRVATCCAVLQRCRLVHRCPTDSAALARCRRRRSLLGTSLSSLRRAPLAASQRSVQRATQRDVCLVGAAPFAAAGASHLTGGRRYAALVGWAVCCSQSTSRRWTSTSSN
jgi:hypothetical protein